MKAANLLPLISMALAIVVFVLGCEQSTEPGVGIKRFQIFYMNRPAGGITDLIKINNDGGNQKRFSNHPRIASPPAFTPNGRDLLYRALIDDQVMFYMMSSDGTNPRVLDIPIEHSLQGYQISLDGKQILFSGISNNRFPGGLYLMNIDGSNIRPLLRTDCARGAARARFSPDGTTIIFDATCHDNSPPIANRDIYTVDLDGRNLQRLTTDRLTEWEPRYTPDGERAIFERPFVSGGFYIMNADGSNERFLANDSTASLAFAVSPLGGSMAYLSDRTLYGGTDKVYLLDLDTGDKRLLAEGLNPRHLVFSPDAAELLIVAELQYNLELHKIVLATGELVWLADGIAGRTFPVYQPFK